MVSKFELSRPPPAQFSELEWVLLLGPTGKSPGAFSDRVSWIFALFLQDTKIITITLSPRANPKQYMSCVCFVSSPSGAPTKLSQVHLVWKKDVPHYSATSG